MFKTIQQKAYTMEEPLSPTTSTGSSASSSASRQSRSRTDRNSPSPHRNSASSPLLHAGSNLTTSKHKKGIRTFTHNAHGHKLDYSSTSIPKSPLNCMGVPHWRSCTNLSTEGRTMKHTRRDKHSTKRRGFRKSIHSAGVSPRKQRGFRSEPSFGAASPAATFSNYVDNIRRFPTTIASLNRH